MKEFWNERYSENEYVYGEDPNEYFKKSLSKLKTGSILLPCDGEGRNAVYAATQHWEVTAFDQSEEAKRKALQLATKKKVKFDFQIADAEDFDYGEDKYDAIALIYAHFSEDLRKKVHSSAVKALKEGGTLILEGFNPNQIDLKSGGPKDEKMLFTKEMIESDFKELTTIELNSLNIELNEGRYHKGKAAVIQYMGRK